MVDAAHQCLSLFTDYDLATPMPMPPSLRTGCNENKDLRHWIAFNDDRTLSLTYAGKRLVLLDQTRYKSAKKPKITDTNVKRGIFRLVFEKIVLFEPIFFVG